MTSLPHNTAEFSVKRREPRFPKRLSVRIWGMDSNNKPLIIDANTADISEDGARIDGVHHWHVPGEIIALKYGDSKARYRIVWIGQLGTPQYGQVGLVRIDTGQSIFAFELASFTQQPKPEVICTPQQSDGDSQQIVGVNADIAAAQDQRRGARYKCSFGVRIQRSGTDQVQWANVSSLNLLGCCIETTSPFPVDTLLELVLYIDQARFAVNAVVRSRLTMSMGVEFLRLDAATAKNLRSTIADLAKDHR